MQCRVNAGIGSHETTEGEHYIPLGNAWNFEIPLLLEDEICGKHRNLLDLSVALPT
jgi:hypothetical protein